MSTVVGNLSLSARENQIGSLFFDVQSDENFRFKIGSLSTVVGRCQLPSREDEIRSLSFDVQSDENAFLKVVKVPESKSVALNDLDEIVSASSLALE